MSKAADPVAERAEKYFEDHADELDGLDEHLKAARFALAELRRLGASAVDVEQCQCGDGGCIECWPTNFTKETLIKHFRERLRIANAWASRNADLESENNMLRTALDVDGLAREIDDYYMGLPSDHETLNDMHQSAVVAHIAAIIRKHIAQPAALPSGTFPIERQCIVCMGKHQCWTIIPECDPGKQEERRDG